MYVQLLRDNALIDQPCSYSEGSWSPVQNGCWHFHKLPIRAGETSQLLFARTRTTEVNLRHKGIAGKQRLWKFMQCPRCSKTFHPAKRNAKETSCLLELHAIVLNNRTYASPPVLVTVSSKMPNVAECNEVNQQSFCEIHALSTLCEYGLNHWQICSNLGLNHLL